MSKARLGILIDESGVTSISVLANDPRGRQEIIGLYLKLSGDIEQFHRQIQSCIRREFTPWAVGGEGTR